MIGVFEAISGIGVHGEKNVWKFLADCADEIQVFPGLDLQLDALISTVEFLFDGVEQCMRTIANSKRNATGNFFFCPTQQFQERKSLLLALDVPQRVLNPSLGHVMATNSVNQGGKFTSSRYVLSHDHRRNKVRDNVPCRVRGLGVVGRRFDSSDFSPSDQTVGDHFHEQDAPVLGDSETGFKWRSQTHAEFAEHDLFNSHEDYWTLL